MERKKEIFSSMRPKFQTQAKVRRQKQVKSILPQTTELTEHIRSLKHKQSPKTKQVKSILLRTVDLTIHVRSLTKQSPKTK